MDGGSPLGESQPRARLASLVRYFVGLGAWGFGGPIATVGYMQRDLVERRAWLTRADFLDGVGLAQAMPGPLAAQVVMWVGFLESGAPGALVTSLAFILPSFVAVFALAYLYVRFNGISFVGSLFYGIAPAAMAIIAVSAVKLARLTDGRDARLWAISLTTLAVTALTGAEIAFLFLLAGALMVLLEAPPRLGRNDTNRNVSIAAIALRLARSNPLAVWAGGVDQTKLLLLCLFFLKAGAFIFGSGLAVVPFLREGVVQQHHWLTEGEFVDAVAIGLITPGPVVITATFIGYLVAGPIGAMVATVSIFVPIYLGVVLPGPWFVRHREHPRLRSFVKGATAAAAGAIVGASIVLGRSSIVDPQTWVIFVAGLLFVLRFKNREPVLVGLAGIAGLLLHH